MSAKQFIKQDEKTFTKLFRMMQVELQYPNFVEITARKLINQFIVDKIQDRMRELNYSKKIIDSTWLSAMQINTNGELFFAIDSSYTTETGFNVADAREFGTRGFFVKPRIKKALRFIKQGIVMFSKGHFIPSKPPSHIISRTIDEFLPVVQAKLDEETDQFFSKILKSND